MSRYTLAAGPNLVCPAGAAVARQAQLVRHQRTPDPPAHPAGIDEQILDLGHVADARRKGREPHYAPAGHRDPGPAVGDRQIGKLERGGMSSGPASRMASGVKLISTRRRVCH